MTNEEKAKRTYPYFEDMNDIEIVQTNAKRLGFIAGCEWKDEEAKAEKQALIDKACEWLKDNINDYYTTNEFEQWFDEMFDDFKQAMKGGKE